MFRKTQGTAHYAKQKRIIAPTKRYQAHDEVFHSERLDSANAAEDRGTIVGTNLYQKATTWEEKLQANSDLTPQQVAAAMAMIQRFKRAKEKGGLFGWIAKHPLAAFVIAVIVFRALGG